MDQENGLDSAQTSNFIFVSYSHSDSVRVLDSVEQLRSDGLDLWNDWSITAGNSWSDEIAGRIANCKTFLAFLSDGYLKSDNCKKEIQYAIAKSKRIVLVSLENNLDRKSTRLNSSHQIISYAVFCLKKKSETVMSFGRKWCKLLLGRCWILLGVW